MKNLIFIIFLVLFFSSFLIGQTPYNSGYGLSNSTTIPVNYSDKYTDNIQHNVDFVLYPYISEQIDLRNFKKRFPQLSAPDFLEILPPAITNFSDVVVLMSLMKGKSPTEKDIVIWLGSNYSTSEVSFFTDNNLDRNFNNDGNTLRIKRGKKPEKVIMGDVKNGAIPQDFWIAIPKLSKPKPTHSTGTAGLHRQFVLGVHAGIGFGNLDYEFDNLETGFPVWYNTKFTEKNIGLSLSYNFTRFRLGLSATYQNQDFYTSYYNIRKGETYSEFINGQRVVYVNVETNRNIDKHPENKIQLAAEIMLRVHLTKMIELQPIFSAGFISFSPGEYIADTRFDQIKYKLEDIRFIEGGLRAEFNSKNNRSLFLSFTANKVFWTPTDFRVETSHENLTTKYLSVRSTVGYNFGL